MTIAVFNCYVIFSNNLHRGDLGVSQVLTMSGPQNVRFSKKWNQISWETRTI